jgi:hypothetical protein
MSDVKLTREGLRAALEAIEDTQERGVGYGPTMQLLIAAARALLAATEPASDEELIAANINASDEWLVRWAAARVRRLAGFGEEGR